jgi:hypothetical protein
MSIVFYDDDLNNITQVSQLPIKCVFITDKPIYLNYKDNQNYHKNFVNNSYYNYFKPGGRPSNGFSMTHAEELLLWINRTSNPIVLFDWDRTITCFDGFAIENYPFTYSSKGVKIQDVIEYICGGYTRINLLSYVFQSIRKKGEIFIVTNNPMSLHNRPEFIKMIRTIDPQFKEKCLIYGNGNKRLALLACNYFMDLTNKK